jgi:putative transposase
MRAIKSVKQIANVTHPLMESFRLMVNECIDAGIVSDATSLNRLSKLMYSTLSDRHTDTPSYYRLCAISHAAGILANRKKSIKRGLLPRKPYASRPFLISCYGFKIEEGVLRIPVGNRQYHEIPLNNYVRKVLSDPSLVIRSFTLSANTLSICYSKEVQEIECSKTVGVDRNLRNLTIGDNTKITHYDLSKAVDIAENTRSITRSFKRNDVRIRRKVYAKYGQRRKNRTIQLLHHVSKAVVQQATEAKTAIAFERLTYIRRLYQKGNYQGKSYRSRLNDWSFAEIKRLISYKAAWEGIPVIQLSKSETRGTSQACPRCGKKITQVDRKIRQLWCAECKRWMDRDVVAAVNISIKGRSRFERSKGLAGEAMVQEPGSNEPVILKVDASKLTLKYKLELTEPHKSQYMSCL